MKTKIFDPSRASVKQPNFSILGFLGIYFIACAGVVPLFAYNLATALPAHAIILGAMTLGYFLQAGVSAATGFRRELESRAYEPEYKYFRANRAVPVWIISAIFAFLVMHLTDRILYERSKLPGVAYDPESALPFTVGLIFLSVTVLGSFVWFFPYNRLMTGGGLYTGIALMLIFFFLYSVMGGIATVCVALCLMGYGFCALFSANQYALGRTYRGTVVSFMTPRTRWYNILLSLGLAGLFALLLFIAYVIVNGIRVCVLFIVAALLAASNSNDVGYTEEESKELYASLSEFLFNSSEPARAPEYWYFILFAVFVVMFITFVLTRRRPEIKAFISWLKAFLVSLFEFIWLPIKDFSLTDDDYFTNYIDEEKKLQKKDIRAKIREESRSRMDYREFSAILRSKPTEEEKYRFAYSTFISQLRRMPMFIKSSDTPRKIKERLTSSGKVTTKHEIDLITEEFEQIEFAAHPADADTKRALETLCDKVRENM